MILHFILANFSQILTFIFSLIFLRYVIQRIQLVLKFNKLASSRETSFLFGHYDRVFNQRKVRGITNTQAVQFMMMSLCKSHPIESEGYLGLWLGGSAFGWPVIVPTRTEVLKPLLSTKERIDKSFIYKMFLDLLGNGLISSNREIWTVHRKLLNPTFHSKLLTGFIPIIRDQAQKLVSKIHAMTSTSDKCEIDNLAEIISATTMAIICETAMGASEDQIDCKYSSSLGRVDRLMVSRFESAFKAIDALYAMTEDGKEFYQRISFVKNEGLKLVRTRIRAFSHVVPEGEVRRTLIDTLIQAHLEDPKAMTEEMIRDEIDTFLAAGHDTTTWGLTWTLVHLGHRHDIQEKLIEEIMSASNTSYSDSCDLSELISIENISRMKFLECVILESLRLNPIVPFFGREINSDMTCNVDGKEVIVPKGASVLVVPDVIHRSPRYWPDPERFKPERFLPENSKNRDPLSFLAFSFGPRNCIGKNFALTEMKIILIHLLTKFVITCHDPLDTIHTDYAIARRCLHPIKFSFQGREHIL